MGSGAGWYLAFAREGKGCKGGGVRLVERGRLSGQKWWSLV